MRLALSSLAGAPQKDPFAVAVLGHSPLFPSVKTPHGVKSKKTQKKQKNFKEQISFNLVSCSMRVSVVTILTVDYIHRGVINLGLLLLRGFVFLPKSVFKFCNLKQTTVDALNQNHPLMLHG